MPSPDTRGWYGVDFSGNHAQWRARVSRPNVWIAAVGESGGRLALTRLSPVQDLPPRYGDHPFDRLASLLAEGEFQAAGIDAPFSIPGQFVNSYEALLQAVRNMPCGGRPFPEGAAFVEQVTGLTPPLNPNKPLRLTESTLGGAQARSTLWAGKTPAGKPVGRPGAPMTAACLTLLARADGPIWPWVSPPQSGLLAEAFPAAQLKTWGLPHQGYGKAEDRASRQAIIDGLASRLSLPEVHEATMLGCADALDAVLCAFAAIAVTEGQLQTQPGPGWEQEGWIAVHQ